MRLFQAGNTEVKNLAIIGGNLLLALFFGLLLSGIFIEPSVPLVVVLVSLPFVLMFFRRPGILITLLLLSGMFAEFYWIEVMRGYLKPFHILSILIFLIFTLFHARVVIKSRIFWMFMAFSAVSLISIFFSDDWKEALRSFVLFFILFSIALNVAVALYTGKISEERFMKIILYGSLVTVSFGLLQMFAYSFGGILLTLVDSQNAQIFLAKRPPSFFTEADTFGKFLSFPFLFFIPFALHRTDKLGKRLRMSVIFLLIGIAVNMTRSAMIGIGFSALIYVIYLFKTKSLGRNVAVIWGTAIVLITIAPFIYGVTMTVGSHEEMKYRIESLINPSSSAIEDHSVAYRKKGVEETIEGTVESLHAFLIGHGWGSSIIKSRGEPKDVGGNLFINILYFSGIFALTVFLLICLRIIRVTLKIARRNSPSGRHLFAEGILFAFIGALAISQFASMWIAPEFWVIAGCAIYLELKSRQSDEASISP